MIGFLNLAKPAGMTAHDVVACVRKLVRLKQVGHAGTLDPLATGVLPIALGKACRLLRFLPSDKTYVADILLGTSTDTDDLEGAVTSTCSALPDTSKVTEALEQFKGQFEQLPPLYSAVHHEGQRLYALARSGVRPEGIKPRLVTVFNLEVLNIALPVVQVRIKCAAGTYIRSIARDLGQKLGCGGCLKALIREQAGPFGLDSSLTLEQLGNTISSDQLNEVLLSPQDVLGLTRVELDRVQVAAIRNGQRLPLAPHGKDSNSHDFIAATCEGKLIAICQVLDGGLLQPEVVIGDGE